VQLLNHPPVNPGERFLCFCPVGIQKPTCTEFAQNAKNTSQLLVQKRFTIGSYMVKERERRLPRLM
jgi:hypothetical protein